MPSNDRPRLPPPLFFRRRNCLTFLLLLLSPRATQLLLWRPPLPQSYTRGRGTKTLSPHTHTHDATTLHTRSPPPQQYPICNKFGPLSSLFFLLFSAFAFRKWLGKGREEGRKRRFALSNQGSTDPDWLFWNFRRGRLSPPPIRRRRKLLFVCVLLCLSFSLPRQYYMRRNVRRRPNFEISTPPIFRRGEKKYWTVAETVSLPFFPMSTYHSTIYRFAYHLFSGTYVHMFSD